MFFLKPGRESKAEEGDSLLDLSLEGVLDGAESVSVVSDDSEDCVFQSPTVVDVL